MQLARFLLTAARHFVAALLLLTVAAHAAVPHAAPLDRKQGSAFSAATSDVSLKSGGKVAVAKQALRIEPPVPAAAVPVALRRSAAPPVPAAGRPAQARAPPASATVFAPLAPRAPPAA